ncbi:archease [Candidatus Parcubacteria bacterium]|nr:MAG: archease [Candidatus Parcubacteria bacterium]
MKSKYKILEHTADLKIQANGMDLAELFCNMATGMYEYIYKFQISKLKCQTKSKLQITNVKNIKLKADNIESLLVDWLSELLYFSDAENLMAVKYDFVKLSFKELTAKVNFIKAQAKDDIKAVTYHDLSVKKISAGWEAIVVFDI